MEYAYRVDAWQALYMAVAGATAALTGLLFIALSLDLPTIIKVPAYRARAREALSGLLFLLVLSLLLLVPGQDHRVLGGELMAASLVTAILGIRLQVQTLRKMEKVKRVRWALRLLLLDLGTMMTILAAGISLILGRFGGLYWLVPTILISLLWSINNAWLLVVQVAEAES